MHYSDALPVATKDSEARRFKQLRFRLFGVVTPLKSRLGGLFGGLVGETLGLAGT